MDAIKTEYKEFNKKISALQSKYEWDETDMDRGGLDNETYRQYSEEYDELERETVEIEIQPVSVKDIDFDVSMEEMKILYFLLEDDVEKAE